jgi:hypothetical protein
MTEENGQTPHIISFVTPPHPTVKQMYIRLWAGYRNSMHDNVTTHTAANNCMDHFT